MYVEIILFGIGVLVAVIGWLLAKRDDKRAEEIKENAAAMAKHRTETQETFGEIFRLRSHDAQTLSDYKLKIAENHYPKTELDSRFNQLNSTMEKGFGSLGEDIRAMTRALTDHITKDHTTKDH
jgi:hypothetical protein